MYKLVTSFYNLLSSLRLCRYLFIFFIIILLENIEHIYAITQAQVQTENTSIISESIIEPLITDSPQESLKKIIDSYKNIRQMQLAGEEEDNIYISAYNTYKEASKAIIVEDISDNDFDQLRGILMDLDNIIVQAAVTYSSKGDKENMTRFAQASIDTQLLPQMANAEFRRDPELYPALVYCAASGAYNAGKIEDAIKYFEVYLNTEDTKYREPVSLFYGQALIQTKQQERGRETVITATNEFPTNFQLLTIAMQLCLDTKRRDLIGPLVERALTLKPNDEKLLNLQAQVLEDQQQYRAALSIYLQLDEMRPNSLNINESIARCYYNLGTSHYNESIMAVSDKDAAKSRRQSNAYFSNAAEKFEELSENDPNNTKYLKAMASSYAVLGNKSKVDGINVHLSALGVSPIAMNDIPGLIGNPTEGNKTSAHNIPSYQEYAEGYVTEEITKWIQKGEFEKVDDYMRRISPESIRKEQKRLSAITEEKYLKEYAKYLRISEMKLQPYDVENETYAVNSDFGAVYIHVPLKNKEAELFKNNWEKVQIRNAKFFIQNDNIAISTITFHSPNGKDYTYNANTILTYEPPVVEVDASKLIAQAQRQTQTNLSTNQNRQNNITTITVESDVDKNIPHNKTDNNRTIALVIANEKYEKVTNVSSAEHDGDIFVKYCHETLGIPKEQILFYRNATYGNTLAALNQLNNAVKALGPDIDIIVYYAGHGVPDEKTMDAYILPIDADPTVMATAYSLKQFYEQLNNIGAANVMVFIDACFSGANRGEGVLSEARGVVLQSKPVTPKGNMFVLSATDGKETALPWTEKNHGLFTYYLLKKLQDSKGNATLQEISDYVSTEVRKTSNLVLNKPQSPKMISSGIISDQLNKKKLRK